MDWGRSMREWGGMPEPIDCLTSRLLKLSSAFLLSPGRTPTLSVAAVTAGVDVNMTEVGLIHRRWSSHPNLKARGIPWLLYRGVRTDSTGWITTRSSTPREACKVVKLTDSRCWLILGGAQGFWEPAIYTEGGQHTAEECYGGRNTHSFCFPM